MPVNVGEEILFECHEGFRSGSELARGARSYKLACSDSCEELTTSSATACVPVRCPPLELPPSSSLVSSPSDFRSLTHLESVLLKCDLGYKANATSCDLYFSVACLDGVLERGAGPPFLVLLVQRYKY
jgi:hypothetical protein